MSLQRICAIVSGGASGLGAATTMHLVRNGAKVVVADLNHDAFLQLEGASSSDDDDSPLKFSKVDVTNEEEVAAALDLAEDEFGEEVNLAVNCAGIAPARKTLAIKKNDDGTVSHRKHSLTEFINAMNVNTIGSFNVARLAADRMARRSVDSDGLRGCIINTASVAAYDGQVGQVAYAASKGAIVGMTLPMARDLAPLGIRVMTVAPGLFMTPLLAGLPEKVSKDLIKNVPCPARFGDPNEYAKLVESIVQNPYLNGEVIRLDGALRMPP